MDDEVTDDSTIYVTKGSWLHNFVLGVKGRRVEFTQVLTRLEELTLHGR